jgi:hypothetical protein
MTPQPISTAPKGQRILLYLLEQTHATNREASAMLAEIVQKITESEWMAATAHRVHMDPHEFYEVVKVGNQWHIKATAQNLEAAKALRAKGYGLWTETPTQPQ